jgi:hypothetical protein
MTHETTTVTISANAAGMDLPPVELTLNGAADCRGRNGWYRAREIVIWRFGDPPMLEVDFWSRRYGDTAPIMVQVPPALAEALAHTLRQLTGGSTDHSE